MKLISPLRALILALTGIYASVFVSTVTTTTSNIDSCDNQLIRRLHHSNLRHRRSIDDVHLGEKSEQQASSEYEANRLDSNTKRDAQSRSLSGVRGRLKWDVPLNKTSFDVSDGNSLNGQNVSHTMVAPLTLLVSQHYESIVQQPIRTDETIDQPPQKKEMNDEQQPLGNNEDKHHVKEVHDHSSQQQQENQLGTFNQQLNNSSIPVVAELADMLNTTMQHLDSQLVPLHPQFSGDHRRSGPDEQRANQLTSDALLKPQPSNDLLVSTTLERMSLMEAKPLATQSHPNASIQLPNILHDHKEDHSLNQSLGGLAVSPLSDGNPLLSIGNWTVLEDEWEILIDRIREARQDTSIRFGWADKRINDSDTMQFIGVGHSSKKVCLMHVGKTAGSTVACNLGFDYECGRQPVPPFRLVEATTNLMHNRVHDCDPAKSFDYYMFTMRHPVHRIQSWFRYEYPAKGPDPDIPVKAPLFQECEFNSLNALVLRGLVNFKCTLPYDQSQEESRRHLPQQPQLQVLKAQTRSSDVCRQRARHAILGFEGYSRHNAFNYRYYASLIPPNATISVLRTEHLAEDWLSMEQLLEPPEWSTQEQFPLQQQLATTVQTNVVANISSSDTAANNTVSTASGEQSASAMTKTEHNALKQEWIRYVSSRYNNKSLDRREEGVDQELTPEATKRLCRGLCIEIQIYKALLRRAVNLNSSQVDASLAELRSTCPLEADASDCYLYRHLIFNASSSSSPSWVYDEQGQSCNVMAVSRSVMLHDLDLHI